MWVHKCDKCRKTIPEKDRQVAITAGFGFGIVDSYQLCKKCGEPIARILKRYKLVDYEEKKK